MTAPAPATEVVEDPNKTGWELEPTQADKDLAAALGQPEPQSAAVDPNAPPATNPNAADQNEEPIMIGDKPFKTKEAALEYAKNLVAEERGKNDAYRQGISDAALSVPQAPQQQQQEPQMPAFDEEKFYADPKGYQAEREKLISDNIMRQVTQTTEAAQTVTKAWTDFYARHPDLQDKQELCQMVVNETDVAAVLGKMTDSAKGFDFLAIKVRDKLKGWGLDALPKTELTNTKTQTPGSGGPGVTQKPVVEKELSFTQQQLDLRKKRAQG